jgi:hypothetical protein
VAPKPLNPGFVVAQSRAVLPPAVLADAVERLVALLPSFERHPLTAGAAALALGYIGSAGPLPDPLGAAPAVAKEARAGKDVAATEKSCPEGEKPSPATTLGRIAALLPTTATIGAREGNQTAAAALGRAATALGLGCLGEERRDVLQSAVKGASEHWECHPLLQLLANP